MSFPNFTQCTMRVPGVTGSLGAGAGPQESSAILVTPEAAIVRQAVSCCKFEETPFLWSVPARKNHLNRSLGVLFLEPFFFNFHPNPSSDISQWLSGR